jgi:hypothetical protein
VTVPPRSLERLQRDEDRLLAYLEVCLAQRDFHGVADAAMDLRELTVERECVTYFKPTIVPRPDQTNV